MGIKFPGLDHVYFPLHAPSIVVGGASDQTALAPTTTVANPILKFRNYLCDLQLVGLTIRITTASVVGGTSTDILDTLTVVAGLADNPTTPVSEAFPLLKGSTVPAQNVVRALNSVHAIKGLGSPVTIPIGWEIGVKYAESGVTTGITRAQFIFLGALFKRIANVNNPLG